MKYLISAQACIFLLAAALHLGARIGPLAEPSIAPAAVVESLCGVSLALAAYALFTRRSWARGAALGAQAFAVAGVFLGIVALGLGRGPRTLSNDLYHGVMLVLLGAGLGALFVPQRHDRVH